MRTLCVYICVCVWYAGLLHGHVPGCGPTAQARRALEGPRYGCGRPHPDTYACWAFLSRTGCTVCDCDLAAFRHCFYASTGMSGVLQLLIGCSADVSAWNGSTLQVQCRTTMWRPLLLCHWREWCTCSGVCRHATACSLPVVVQCGSGLDCSFFPLGAAALLWCASCMVCRLHGPICRAISSAMLGLPQLPCTCT